MPGTEDIAEKVAKELFEQGLRAAEIVTDAGPKIIKGIGAFSTDHTNKLIEAIRKDKQMRHLLKMEGEISLAEMDQILHKFSLRSSSISVADSDAKDFETLLNEQGVLYVKMEKQDDNQKMFIFLNRDVTKVENVTTILKARRGNIAELRPDLYFNALSPDKVHVVEGISGVEMELFRHYAREKGLLYTAIPRKEDYMVVCNEDDTKKFRETMLHVGWALTGANGARIREQVERRLAGRSAIRINAEEADKEMYIVSGVRPSQYVKISERDFAVYKQNQKVMSVSRKDPDFLTKCMAASEALAHPVVLSANQFRDDLTPEDMENAHTIDLFPDNFETLLEMEMANRLAQLAAKEDPEEEHSDTWGLADPNVTYASYAQHEYIMDDDEREARQYEFEHFKQAAYYSHDHHTTHEVAMDQKNIDYLIAKAEKKRKDMEGKEPQRSGIDYSWNYGSGSRGEDSGREE